MYKIGEKIKIVDNKGTKEYVSLGDVGEIIKVGPNDGYVTVKFSEDHRLTHLTFTWGYDCDDIWGMKKCLDYAE